MGNEAACTASWGTQTSKGKALLESTELIFRGDFRLKVPFTSMKGLEARGGAMSFRFEGDLVRLELGAEAATWAEKIRNPKTRIDKLGVKPGQVVSVLGVDDAEFPKELETLGATVHTRATKGADVIFLGAKKTADLAKIKTLIKSSMDRDGSLWVVRPKGVKSITEKDSMAAGHAAGLVDVKVVAFSETHTAEKYVIPKKYR